jgi:6,7-dimethyl-8-ribityllumazine synthase
MLHTLPAAAGKQAPTPAAPMRVAFISAAWHPEIVERARLAASSVLTDAGVELDHFEVPGAFEIPLHAQTLAQSGQYHGVIACALVVNGGIYRHDFVASAVVDGLMQVQMNTGVPVFSAVLTPRDFHEHEEHRSFFLEHFTKKGKEVASACLQTLASLNALRSRLPTGAPAQPSFRSA